MPPYRLLLIPFAVVIWNGCAQQGSPSGGPRDEDPPRVVEADPPNYSTRFDSRRFEITFDEFIVLENVNNQLIVSPPMEEKPEVKLRKRTIIVELEEELKPNTTYTFNFGSAIKDLHEGNLLLNFEYVFSTGDVLDSMSVRGTLKYARDLSEPEEPISVMLYEELQDSVPLTKIPLYIGRSDDSGVFSVNNLRPDVYKVFALKDGNNNFLYDLPSEEIAFLDTSLTVHAEFARRLLEEAGLLDTAAVDSATSAPPRSDTPVPGAPEADTLDAGINADTLAGEGPDLTAIYIELFLFTEESEIQYITDYTREDPRKVEVSFALPVTDSFRYRMTDPAMRPVHTLEYMNPERDSLSLWVTDSTDYRKDTLHLFVDYTVKDTIPGYLTRSDTLVFRYRPPEPGSRGNGQERKEDTEELRLSTLRSNAQLDLNRDIPVSLNLPLAGIADSLIHLFHIPDSVEIPEPFTAEADSVRLTRAWIRAGWESASDYRLVIYPGAFTSIYPVTHDTVDVTFSTRDEEYYGRILLSLEQVEQEVIIQLIQRDQVIRETVADRSGSYVFGYLAPQTYAVKFIHDLNGNGKWDTGDYLEHRQPEPVEFLPAEINVRSNWDHDVSMRLER